MSEISLTIHNSTDNVFHFRCGSNFSLNKNEKKIINWELGSHIYAIKEIGDKEYHVIDSSLDYSIPTIDCKDIDFGVTRITFNGDLSDLLNGMSNNKVGYIQKNLAIEGSKWFQGHWNTGDDVLNVYYHYDEEMYQKTVYNFRLIGIWRINFKDVYVYVWKELQKLRIDNQKESILNYAKKYSIEKDPFYDLSLYNQPIIMDYLDIKDIKHKSMIMFAFNLIQILYHEINVDIRGRGFYRVLSPIKLLSYLPLDSNNDYINLIKRIINQVSTISFKDIITTLEGIKLDRMTFKRDSTLLVFNHTGYDIRVMARVPWNDRFIIKSLDTHADNRGPVYFTLKLNNNNNNNNNDNNNNNNINVVNIYYYRNGKTRFNELVQDGVFIVDHSKLHPRDSLKYEPKDICKQLLKNSNIISPIKNQINIFKFISKETDPIKVLVPAGFGDEVDNYLSTKISIHAKDSSELNTYGIKFKTTIVLVIHDNPYNHIYYHEYQPPTSTIDINQSFLDRSEYIVSIPSHLKTEDLVKELLKDRDVWDSVDHIKVGVIGNGSYGRVDLILQKRKGRKRRLVAIKYLKDQMNGDKEIKMNDTILQLYHRNLIKVYDINQKDNTITMEYAHQGTLIDYIKRCRLTSNQVIELMIGVCKGIKYLHNQDIIHRDIKPNNIVIDKYGVPMICDFGTSKHLLVFGTHVKASNADTYQGIGSPGYLAPEIQENLNPAQEYDGKSIDVYAFGVTLLVVMLFSVGKEIKIAEKKDVYYYSSSIHCSYNGGDIKCKQCDACTKIQQKDVCRCIYGASCKECDSKSNHDGCTYSYDGDSNGLIKVCKVCPSLRDCKSCIQCMKCKTISKIIKLCTNSNINIRPTFKEIVSLLKYSLISSDMPLENDRVQEETQRLRSEVAHLRAENQRLREDSQPFFKLKTVIPN